MRHPVTALLCIAGLAACDQSSGLTQPSDETQVSAAIIDALERIAPALGNGSAAVELRASLEPIVHRQTNAGMQRLLQALDQLATDPAYSADADAIRLALAAHS
jgi:hypothetical protein